MNNVIKKRTCLMLLLLSNREYIFICILYLINMYNGFDDEIVISPLWFPQCNNGELIHYIARAVETVPVSMM